jgi:hypothetical protein
MFPETNFVIYYYVFLCVFNVRLVITSLIYASLINSQPYRGVSIKKKFNLCFKNYSHHKIHQHLL